MVNGNVKLIHSLHGCLLRDTIPFVHSFHIPPPYKLSPPKRQDSMRCDVVCQVITLLNIPTGQSISLLLTHIVDLYSFTYKIIPSVNNYM